MIVGPAEGADPSAGREARVSACRAYRDRLVLKLEGVDSPTAAAELGGMAVFAPADEVPALPDGEYWMARLRGMDVVDPRGGHLGRVEDVLETGGTDLLSVKDDAGREVLVPLARQIVLAVSEDARSIVVDLPEGLAELNRDGGGA